MGETPVRSVERAINILYCLANGEKGLAEICAKVNLEKGTVHRHLSSLINKGIASQNPATSKYTLGLGFFDLVYKMLNSHDTLVAIAREPMDRIYKLSKETVVLDVPQGLYRLCVAQVRSIQDIIYSTEVGAALPLYAGAVGRVILGCMSKTTRERFIENVELVPFTNNTIIDRRKLLEEVELASIEGYAISFGERVEGSACISVPIMSRTRLIAVLSILGPNFRMNQQDLLSYLPTMQAEASLITRDLGVI